MSSETDAGKQRPSAGDRIVDAEVRLARARHRLNALRQAALTGHCSSSEYDAAILEFRAAAADASPRFIPTRRQEFVRWLYQAGRISESF